LSEGDKPQRFALPLMQAFREAFRSRDSRKHLDLRDESGNRVLSGRRSTPRRNASEQSLKDELSEDILSLLNTVNLESALDIRDLAHVRASILNYGLTDISRITIDESAAGGLGDELRKTLSHFEARLVPGSIDVNRDGYAASSKDMKVRFNVRADMHAAPLDIPVDFVAEVEVDNAKMKLSKL